MNYVVRNDPVRRGRALYLHLLSEQRQWIESCEKNGRSYTGPNGTAIREADEAELHRLEARLASTR